jgi:hypothetical protein
MPVRNPSFVTLTGTLLTRVKQSYKEEWHVPVQAN